MTTPSRLGPFAVIEKLGEGGMGVVYRGRHIETNAEVALKVVGAGSDDRALDYFRREVQAHASLDHPGIVRLFEYGGVDSRHEEGRGLPFVAMELADATVRDLLPFRDWVSARDVVAQVLDALAFAHARGVIHCDLKPENLLVFSDDARAGRRIKLADFGIAHAVEAAQSREAASLTSFAGTPDFAAPEQIQGLWRDFGPWTDLYAVGCMLWTFVCGRTPFAKSTPLGVMVAHCREPRPRLEPVFATPEGLETWLTRAMAIAPGSRFQRAADAFRALPAATARSEDDVAASERPPGEADPDRWRATASGEAAPTIEMSTLLFEGADLIERDEGGLDEIGVAETIRDASLPETTTAYEPSARSAPGHAPVRPPIPPTWRRPGEEDLEQSLQGTGLGLFGLREIPFVDRDEARDQIWSALRRVEETGDPHVVVVTGESGVGKSRLVDWMLTRAEELGAAQQIRANYSRDGGPSDGLAGLIRRAFNGWKITRTQLRDRLASQLPRLTDDDDLVMRDAEALTALVFPPDVSQDARAGSTRDNRRERRALFGRLVKRFLRQRATVVWFDDAQWGMPAIELTDWVLNSAFAPPAALFLLTIRSDLLASEPRLERSVSQILRHENCHHIHLGPLDNEDQTRLVRRMLPVDDRLAEALVQRTEGNPLFASQLLGKLIEAERIRPGPFGFAAEDEVLDLPDTIHDLWLDRLRSLFGQMVTEEPDRLWRAVEIGALFGREIEAREWNAICASCGVRQPLQLRAMLIDRGLAKVLTSGWAFAHALLVTSLERRADETGDAVELHRACAELLEGLYPEAPVSTAARRARHWLAAGDDDRALSALLQQRAKLRMEGDQENEYALLKECSDILDRLGADEFDRRRIEVEIRLASSALLSGVDVAQVAEDLRRSVEKAEQISMNAEAAVGMRLLSLAHARLGDPAAAEKYAILAVDRARAAGDRDALAWALIRLGSFLMFTGRTERAEDQIDEAARVAKEGEDSYFEAVILLTRGQLDVVRGRTDDAANFLERALRVAAEVGSARVEVEAMNSLGELARFAGDADRAATFYKAARRGSIESGMEKSSTALTRLNQGMVELMRANWEGAERDLEASHLELLASGVIDAETTFELAGLVVATGRGDWSAVESVTERLEMLREIPFDPDQDHPWLLGMAAGYARERGKEELALRLDALAEKFGEHLQG